MNLLGEISDGFTGLDTAPSCEPGFAREAGDVLEYVHDRFAECEEGLREVRAVDKLSTPRRGGYVRGWGR